MKQLSTAHLAATIRARREQKGLTQENLGNLTGINRVMIGRIEHEDFVPSIAQLEALAKTLEFNITDMFVDQPETDSFVALRSRATSESAREDVDMLFRMILTLRQQILLRRKLENATSDRA